MKKKSFCTGLALAILIVGAERMNAQVTIGDSKTPETFSQLEIVSGDNTGLRLPQITTTAKRDAMFTNAAGFKTNPQSKGLQIFNMQTNQVETWDGTQWIGAGIITEVDGVIGNEITNTSDETLVRSGSGTATSPYQLRRAALTGDVTATAGSNATTIANNAVTSAKIADGAVSSEKIASGVITGAAWGLSGNSITSSNFLGSTNAQPLVFKVNNTEVMRAVNTTGNVGIEVSGAARNTSAFSAGSNRTIDFSQSNLAYTTASAGGTFTLNNMKDGGTYTLAVQGTTSGTAAFTASGFTVKIVNDQPTVAGKETLYTIIVMGTKAYVYVAAGF